MQVVAYVRCSTQEQRESALGLEAQRLAIAQEVERRGWELIETFEDAASGKSLAGRRGLEAAIEALESGTAEALVTAKLDRLSRSLLDFAGLMERSRRKGWSICALDVALDTSTPSGEMMASVLSVFSQFERRMIGARTRDALAAKRAQGFTLGRPRSMSPEAIQRARELRAEGLPLARVAERLNLEAVPTPTGSGRWHGAGVARALRHVA